MYYVQCKCYTKCSTEAITNYGKIKYMKKEEKTKYDSTILDYKAVNIKSKQKVQPTLAATVQAI